MRAVDRKQNIGGADGEFLAREAAQVAGVTQRGGDALKSIRDERPGREGLAVNLSQHRFRRHAAVRETHALVARVSGPLVHVLKQVMVNGFEVCGVEASGRAVSKLNLQKTIGDVIGLGRLKRGVTGRAKFVLDGYPVVERVTRHRSGMMVQRLEARQNLVKFDLAVYERIENRRALRASELALDAIARVRLAQRRAPPFHLRGAGLGSWPGGDVVHAIALPSPFIVAEFGLEFIRGKGGGLAGLLRSALAGRLPVFGDGFCFHRHQACNFLGQISWGVWGAKPPKVKGESARLLARSAFSVWWSVSGHAFITKRI